ncbi:MAG: hypothetical protein KAX11_04060 [Candidatus Aminicenantes bacterium]|nr:hypothetical protein [Candidatus Aminicenantes bacterium]
MRKGLSVFFLALGVSLLIWGVGLGQEDLCQRINMKPVLSLEQLRQAELVDILSEIAGLKELPEWPRDISEMTPEQYYEMEVQMLIDNGFPPIFIEIEPSRIVNRRYFASLMFQIAMEVDREVQQDCGDAATETEQLQCLVDHEWIYTKEGRIYQDEILATLCNKRDKIKDLIPVPPVVIPPIVPEEFVEATLESPASESY